MSLRAKRSASSKQQHPPQSPKVVEEMGKLNTQMQWIILAIASGACAAFNGVFAKLTTTDLTTQWATVVATTLGLGRRVYGVEVIIRAMFFGLNLLFNGIMWALFTKALTHGTSTVQVSILNTSSNFLITAVLGCLIFSERLPPMWFAGATLLVVGNVIIGRREEHTVMPLNPVESSREGLLTIPDFDQESRAEAESNSSVNSGELQNSENLIRI